MREKFAVVTAIVAVIASREGCKDRGIEKRKRGKLFRSHKMDNFHQKKKKFYRQLSVSFALDGNENGM